MSRTMKQAAGLAAGFMKQTQHQPMGRGIRMVQRCVTTHDPAPAGNLNIHSGRTIGTPVIGQFPKGGIVSMDARPVPPMPSDIQWGTPQLVFAQGMTTNGSFLSGYVDARFLAVCPSPDQAALLFDPFQRGPALSPPVQSASQALTAILRQQALPADQGRLPSGGGGYKVGKMGVHGLPEDNMQSDLVSMAAGLGSLFTGFGVPGPYGANPSAVVPSGTYEISGTAVAFRDAPSLGGAIIDTFNPDTSGGNSVVGTPDQVAFNGQTGTGNGLTWANVTAKGKTGFVAIEYMAPVGWTAKQGKVVPGGGGGGNIEPASVQTDKTTTSDYTPYILGGAAVLGGGIILWAVLAKPKKGGGKHRSAHRRRAHA